MARGIEGGSKEEIVKSPEIEEEDFKSLVESGEVKEGDFIALGKSGMLAKILEIGDDWVKIQGLDENSKAKDPGQIYTHDFSALNEEIKNDSFLLLNKEVEKLKSEIKNAKYGDAGLDQKQERLNYFSSVIEKGTETDKK